MADQTDGRLTRRQLLKLGILSAGMVASASALAGCQGGSSAPQGQTSKSGTAPTAAPAQVKGGKLTLSVWNSPSFNKTADDAIGDVFREWAGQNNATIDYQIIPATEWKQRITAALEAKAPPDIFYVFEADTQYYRAQGLLQDLTDVINAVKDQDGGLFPSTLLNTGFEGKYYAVPFVVNPWPMHARTDILKAAGVAYPKTWDDVIKISPKVSKPPQVYTYALSLGNNHDTEDNFVPMMWSYGAKMEDENGALLFKSDGTVQAIEIVKEMFDKKVVPPGATTWDSSGNNKAYQSGQAVFSHNPNSIYAYLESEAAKPGASQQMKDLLTNTAMMPLPAGPKGTFDLIDVRGFAAFTAASGAKNPDAAKAALKNFIQPAKYEKVIETGLNRWAPVYKNMMDRPMWDKPAYARYKDMMQHGQSLSYAGAPNAALGEVADSWIIPNMLQEVCTSGKDPKKAMNDAYDKIAAIYKKWKQPIA